jgi:hypothetical protein
VGKPAAGWYHQFEITLSSVVTLNEKAALFASRSQGNILPDNVWSATGNYLS